MKKLKTVFFYTVFSLLTVMQAGAVKATSEVIRMQQPDGTTLMVRLHGDENSHYLTTTDDYLIARDHDGFWKYAVTKENEPLKLGRMVARNLGERTAEEAAFVSRLRPAGKAGVSLLKSRFKRMPGLTLSKSVLNPRKYGGAERKSRGIDSSPESRFPVILVNFRDSGFKYEASDFDRWLNEPGYSVNSGTGSVKDYYRDNSMGQFIPHFDVYGPVDLDFPVAFYGGNSSGAGTDVAPMEMVEEACLKAKAAYPEINFADYDNDGDGIMDNVNVIFAGYSEATTGIEDLVWPHTYHLDGKLQIDGVKIYNYSCSAEFVGASGEQMDGIGTFVHEFGHVLGLKDLYDTDDYTGGLGLDPGSYSLMASGSYNNDSRTPPCLMAFERIMLGWYEPEMLSVAADIVLPPVSANKAYCINARPDLDPTVDGYELFVLENRQKTGWDAYLPAHGLLIYHWDYTAESFYNYWSVNGPNNNAAHRCLYIKCADGIDDISTRNGDTYPGRSGNTEFTDTSFPDALSWAGGETGVPITNIREEKGIIYFQVKRGVGPVSQIRTGVPSEITENSAKVTATVIKKEGNIREMGFCWDLDEEPGLERGNKQVVVTADTAEFQITGLQPASLYNIRAYMIMENGDVFYGAAIPFNTECSVKTAPYVDDFTSWTDGVLDCWKIVDANRDGTTWVYDKNTRSIVYTFDYWNKANDWLISPKIRIPENGYLFFSRAITEVGYTEKLEIWVSTGSKEIKDFHLCKKYNFADYYGVMHFEQVNLGQYAGQEVYIAFVCRSEKLNNALWMKDIYVTSKLPDPILKTFAPYENETGQSGMRVQWKPVDGAENYYVTIEQEHDTVNSFSKFLSEADYAVTENVEIESAKLFFPQSGMAETVDFPGGITNMMFIYKGSGPFGESTVHIQGTEDGKTWEAVGSVLRIRDVSENEYFLTDYLKNKKYRKFRFTCNWNGRNVILQYLTLQYNENKIRTLVTGGSVGKITDVVLPFDYFTPGETYIAYVNASDGLLYYNSSNEISCTYQPTSVYDAKEENRVVAFVEHRRITVRDAEAGSKIECIGISGAILRTLVAGGDEVSFEMDGYTGVAFIRITGKERGGIFKIYIK